MYTPLSIGELVVFVTCFTLGTGVFGVAVWDVLRKLSRVIQRDLEHHSAEMDGPQQTALFLSLGILAQVTIIFLYTALRIPITGVSIAGSLLLAVLFVLVERRSQLTWRTIITALHRRSQALWVLLLFVLIIGFRLYPMVGQYVHPGDDPVQWTYLANQIVTQGQYPTALELHTPLDLQRFDPHLMAPGLPSLVVYWELVTQLGEPKVLMVVSALLNALACLAIYVLAQELTRSTIVAWGSAISMAVLSYTPLYWKWGGNAEQTLYFLIPVVVWLLLRALRRRYVHIRGLHLLVTAALLSLVAMVHIVGVIVLVTAIGAMMLFFLLRGDAVPLRDLVIVVGVSFLIVGGFAFIHRDAILGSIASSQQYPATQPEHVTVAPLIRTDVPLGATLQWVAVFLNSFLGLPLLVLALLSIIVIKQHKPTLVIAWFWLILLFVLHEHDPRGLYYSQAIPWFLRMYRFRLALLMAIPLSLLAGVGVAALNHALDTEVLRTTPREPSDARWQKLEIVLLVLLVVTSGLVWVATTQQQLHAASTFNTYLDEDDLAAFSWIQDNTPRNASFFIMDADGGAYLPLFTQHTVFPGILRPTAEAVYRNASYLDAYAHIRRDLLRNPEAAIPRLRQYGVTHIYVSATAFSRSELTVARFENTSFHHILDWNTIHVFRVPRSD
jgi:hypothetical protein